MAFMKRKTEAVPDSIKNAETELMKAIFRFSTNMAEKECKDDTTKLQSMIAISYQMILQSVARVILASHDALLEGLDRTMRESSGMEK